MTFKDASARAQEVLNACEELGQYDSRVTFLAAKLMSVFEEGFQLAQDTVSEWHKPLGE